MGLLRSGRSTDAKRTQLVLPRSMTAKGDHRKRAVRINPNRPEYRLPVRDAGLRQEDTVDHVNHAVARLDVCRNDFCIIDQDAAISHFHGGRTAIDCLD